MLGGVAAVTRTLRIGALVYGIDYRHPVVYARQAATLQAMSGGRHEFGIGAGWMIDDYEWAGMRYDKPSVRIERLEEALTIIESMWSKKKTTFAGKHYRVNEAPMKIEMPSPPQISDRRRRGKTVGGCGATRGHRRHQPEDPGRTHHRRRQRSTSLPSPFVGRSVGYVRRPRRQGAIRTRSNSMHSCS